MKIYLKDGNYTLAKDFPMSVFEIRDTLDRLRKFQSREVLFRLSEFGNTELPQSLCGKEFQRIFTSLTCSPKGMKAEISGGSGVQKSVES